MVSMHNRAVFVSTVFALAAVVGTSIAVAQPSAPGPRSSGRSESMMGPGMMDRQLLARMCGPRMAGFAEWRLDRLERAIKLTEAQRPKFEEFKTASNKAVEMIRAACPADAPTTVTGRMEVMEKRLDAILQAVKLVRPTFEAFYTTLSDEQKANLDGGNRRERMWRWRDRW